MDSILKALFEFCLKNRHDHTIYKHAGDSTRSKVNDNFEKKIHVIPYYSSIYTRKISLKKLDISDQRLWYLFRYRETQQKIYTLPLLESIRRMHAFSWNVIEKYITIINNRLFHLKYH